MKGGGDDKGQLQKAMFSDGTWNNASVNSRGTARLKCVPGESEREHEHESESEHEMVAALQAEWVSFSLF